MPFHKDQAPTVDPNNGPHVVHYYTFDNTTDRDAGTDSLKGAVTFTAADIGRVCRVGTAAPYDFFILRSTVPLWDQINGGAEDHGALSGLGDDDHTQYLLADGTRSMSGSLNMGSQSIIGVNQVDGRDVATDGTKLDTIENGATQDQNADEVPFTADGDIAATDVQAAIVEVRDDADTKLASKLDATHAGTGGAAHAEATTSVAGFLSAADKTKLDGISPGGTDDQVASEVPFTPDGDIAATDVQDAIVEVRDDADTKLGLKLDATHAGTGGAAHANATTSVAGFLSSTDKTKLDGIETAATADQDAVDVPYDNSDGGLSATNVKAALDELDGNIGGGGGDHGALGGLADDDHTQYTRADGTRAFTGNQSFGGNDITSVGTVDGRDVATDGTKLDGIEAGATADQSAAEVAFTANGDIAATNVQAAISEVRTDADTKLALKADIAHQASHIQGGAAEIDGDQIDIDFTPSTYTPSTTPAEVSDVDHLSAHFAGIDDFLGSITITDDQNASEVPFTADGDIASTNVQDAVVEVRDDTDTKLANKLDTTHAGTGGTAHAEATTSVAGFLSAADKTKLDAVETGATADQSAAEVSYDNSDGGLTATNVKAALDELDAASGGGGTSDHGALTGLGDDDHAQYARTDGTRAFTGNQSFGGNNATAVGLVDLEIATEPAFSEGRLYYDEDERALVVLNDQSAVRQQLGQEFMVRVYNASGASIPDGTPVYVTGTQLTTLPSGGTKERPTIAPAQANADPAYRVIGVTTQTIADAAEGLVTNRGLANGIDLSAFSSGDVLYLSETTAGGFRNTPPPAGSFLAVLGYVIDNGVSGSMLVVAESTGIANAEGIALAGGYDVISNATNLENAMVDIDNRLRDARTTGSLTGGELTVNGTNPENVDISAGSVAILDNTDPLAPDYTFVDFAGVTDVSPATQISYFYVDATGTIGQQSAALTAVERRTRCPLGVTSSAGGVGTNITGSASRVVPVQQISQQLRDFSEAIGKLRVTGAVMGPGSVATLELSISAGKLLEWGANFHNDPLDPHTETVTAASPLTFRRALSTGSQTTDRTTVDVTQYESAPGVLTNLGNNRWQIKTFFRFPGGNVRALYGQNEYGSLAIAEAALATRSVTIPAAFTSNGFLLGYLIVQRGTVDLTTGLTSKFISTNQFGGIGGGTAGVSSAVTSVNGDPGPTVTLNEFASDVFRVQDNTDTTKELDFDVSALTTGTTRTITMPDADVDLGAIGGGGGSTPTNAATDFTSANYYSAAANTLVGNTSGFVVSVLVRFKSVPDSGATWFFGNHEVFQAQGGWGFGHDNDRFKYNIHQASTGGALENFVGADFPTDFSLLGRLFLLTMVYDGTSSAFYVNAQEEFDHTPADGYEIADSGNQPMIGRNNNSGSPLPSPHVEVLGCGYDETVPTATEVAAHYLACFEADEFVDGGIGFSNMWSFDGETSGPATLSDIGDGTAVDFTEQGTVVTSEIKRRH